MRFTVQSTGASPAAPFCLGFAFRQGDVPAGQGIVGSISDLQASIKNRWPDGSARIVVVAGRAALSANQPLSVALGAGTPVDRPVLTLADLKRTGVTAAIGCGTIGAV
jgi:hypothetical protein